MPFTGSHPAAILPFLRTTLPASALVIGSMTPDIPYYLPVGLPWVTHSAGAVVSTDVLLGGLTWALWHGVLAAPALATAPAGLRARLAGRVPTGLRVCLPQLALVVAALVVGAATHVLWDEFSHAHRWGTAHIPALSRMWGPWPGYLWVQELSGLAGATILIVWLVRWWRRTPPQPEAGSPARLWAWAVLAATGVAAGGLAARGAPTIGSAGFAGVTAAGGAVLAVAVVLALAWHVRRRTAG